VACISGLPPTALDAGIADGSNAPDDGGDGSDTANDAGQGAADASADVAATSDATPLPVGDAEVEGRGVAGGAGPGCACELAASCGHGRAHPGWWLLAIGIAWIRRRASARVPVAQAEPASWPHGPNR
jgi:hypothetical protein